MNVSMIVLIVVMLVLLGGSAVMTFKLNVLMTDCLNKK